MTWRLALVMVAAASNLARADAPVPVPEPIWISAVTATSTYADPHDAYDAQLVAAPKVTPIPGAADVRYDSAWCEGKPDAGLGESITFTFPVPTALPKISIKAGVWKTAALFAANNIPTGLQVTTSDGRVFALTPPPKRDAIEVPIGGAPITSLTVKLTAVKPGRMNDSCITEVEFGDGGTGALIPGLDAAGIAAYRDAVRTLWAALIEQSGTACDAKVLARYADFPFAYDDIENTHSNDPDHRFVAHHKKFASAAAWQKACAGTGFQFTGGLLENGALVAGKPGRVAVRFDRADSSTTMELAYKSGAWKLLTLD